MKHWRGERTNEPDRARLAKLEAISSPSRLVVVVGHSDAEHEAKIQALQASGEASERVTFVCIRRFSEPKRTAMKASNETRLRRIEADQGSRYARIFVIEGTTEAERDQYIARLIRSGEAKSTDTFIYTGVPRAGSLIDHGPIPELMDRIATHGRKIHDPRD